MGWIHTLVPKVCTKTLFSEFSVVCKTNVIWFGVGKCFQDHWKKIPILVYIILDYLYHCVFVKLRKSEEAKGKLNGLFRKSTMTT